MGFNRESVELIGINDDILKSKIVSLYDYLDKIEDKLNTIDGLMAELPKHYQSEDAKKIIAKFDGQKAYYDVVTSNIDKYIKDINKARINFGKIDNNIHINARNDTSK